MLTEKFISVSLISPEKKLYEGGAISVTLPGSNGEFTILPGHANIVSVLNPGIVTIKNDEKENIFIVGGGFVEASHNQVNTLIEDIIDITNVHADAEMQEINKILSHTIPQEKRAKIENELAKHRLRISLSQKK
jgi:ATP synthase F1 epsilon subunit